jgi:hypothetical protein
MIMLGFFSPQVRTPDEMAAEAAELRVYFQ